MILLLSLSSIHFIPPPPLTTLGVQITPQTLLLLLSLSYLLYQPTSLITHHQPSPLPDFLGLLINKHLPGFHDLHLSCGQNYMCSPQEPYASPYLRRYSRGHEEVLSPKFKNMSNTKLPGVGGRVGGGGGGCNVVKEIMLK